MIIIVLKIALPSRGTLLTGNRYSLKKRIHACEALSLSPARFIYADASRHPQSSHSVAAKRMNTSMNAILDSQMIKKASKIKDFNQHNH